MLGLIFTGGNRPETKVIHQLIKSISDKVLLIAADSGLLTIEDAGLNPDWIIGDMDSIDTASRLEKYKSDRVIRHNHDKDFTDTELAFSLAVEQSCDDIWIIGGGGGRIDHLFGIRSMLERKIFPSRWITDNEDIRCIEASNREQRADSREQVTDNREKIAENNAQLSCCIERGAVVSVFPLGDIPWAAESAGLKWPLAGLLWDRGFFGLSNVAVDGKFSITAKQGRFMVILPIEKN